MFWLWWMPQYHYIYTQLTIKQHKPINVVLCAQILWIEEAMYFCVKNNYNWPLSQLKPAVISSIEFHINTFVCHDSMNGQYLCSSFLVPAVLGWVITCEVWHHASGHWSPNNLLRVHNTTSFCLVLGLPLSTPPWPAQRLASFYAHCQSWYCGSAFVIA